MSLKENLIALHSQIQSSGRNVVLIAVSKTKPISLIQEAIQSNHFTFGENKIKEGIEKFESLKEIYKISLHHLGPVQSGTSRKLFGIFDYTHGVSSTSTLDGLLKDSEKLKKNLRYFLQVNLTGEDSKNGFSEIELDSILGKVSHWESEYLKFEGLMTMGPSSEDPTQTRAVFAKLNQIRKERIPAAKLSMGMSGDYSIALEEGSDYIRIGSLLFGSREAASL